MTYLDSMTLTIRLIPTSRNLSALTLFFISYSRTIIHSYF